MSLPALVEPASELTVDEVRRYSRHLIIPDVGMTGQKRLKNAKVLVVGAGGLGSPALLYLAAAGVGTLGIIDFDVVDESNLQRQIIHGQSDIGQPKAVSAKESIQEANPYVDVVLHEERLDSTNVLEIFARLRPHRRRHRQLRDPLPRQRRGRAAEQALRVGLDLPLRRAGQRLLGRDTVRATAASTPSRRRPAWCRPAPRAACSACCARRIGSIQVNEAIKLLTGIGDPLVGRLMVYDALEMTYRQVKIRKDPECVVCGKNPEITLETGLIDYEAFCGTISEEAAEAAKGSTISVKDLKAMMDAGKDFYLVDVREPNEFEIVSIPGATLIPKDRILSGEALAELPQDKPVVLHCKSGARSAETLAVLKGAGFSDAVHVGGGVIAWANQIDPSLPTY